MAADECGLAANPIACENALPGTDPDVWDIDGAGANAIQGFSTDVSVNVGGRIDFKVDTDARAYQIDIYRVGYYQGLGARKITSVNPSATLPQRQPECITDRTTELYDCGNWAVSASWNVPSTAVSGVYLAKLTRTDTGEASHITFVVRNEASHSDVVFQTSDTTWQAYNTYGGSDFYQGGGNGRAYKVSYNRPVMTRKDNNGRDFFFSAEYPLVRFLERNGYDTSYIAGVDTDRRGAAADEPQGVPLGRPRRVLERRSAGQRRGGPGRRRQPAVPQRQRGLLEDPVRAVRRRQPDAVPDPGLLQGDLGQRQDRSQRPVDGDLARPPVRRS